MFYLDTNRNIVRRGSSLIRDPLGSDREVNWASQAKASNESITSALPPRPKGIIQKELVTTLFEAMLSSILDSWHVISVKKPRVMSCEIEIIDNVARCKVVKKARGAVNIAAASKSTMLRKNDLSKLDSRENQVVDPMNLVWWSGPDQRATIKFKNGNIYQGDVSMSCMNGQGRFEWNDGTVYIGNFKDNEMVGKGMIIWKDDTWYEGDFSGNLRHGYGMFVDSRKQKSYTGGWQCGTKHGTGKMYYSKDIYDSYDGEWVKNLRHGFGAREYCRMSGYMGYWDTNIREGKGLMIWPNHDCYRGDWKDGVMSGKGIYMWDTTQNYSLSSPSVKTYSGDWNRGQRHGYGYYNLGTGWGSCYEGRFKHNKKHGSGKLVTNNGLMLKTESLFNEDNLAQFPDETVSDRTNRSSVKAYDFNMCNNQFGLLHHVQQAYLNLDRQEEIRAAIIDEYIGNIKSSCLPDTDQTSLKKENLQTFVNFITFENDALCKIIKAYEPILREIYYKYAKICNKEEIKFTPVLIRLYMWQLYFDCKIHTKGLTLVDIDNLLYDHKDCFIEAPHNPFELIYYWQFLHSLISVARKLYAIRHLPGPRPETIVAEAFKTFMDIDVLPNISNHKGHLVHGYANFIPLQALYNLYTKIGEPHTVHTFLRAVRRPYDFDFSQPEIEETHFDDVIEGYNAYVMGDVLAYVYDNTVGTPKRKDANTLKANEWSQHIPLFNFANLSSKFILDIFANIFPGVYESEKFINLEYKLSFFEFFEAFISCAIESVSNREEVYMRLAVRTSVYDTQGIINV